VGCFGRRPGRRSYRRDTPAQPKILAQPVLGQAAMIAVAARDGQVITR